MHEKEYLELLIRSLKKKLLILNKLAILNQDQRDILQDEKIGRASCRERV